MPVVKECSKVAVLVKDGKEVTIKREFTNALVEAHGIIASQEDWFFTIIPRLQVRQRLAEMQPSTP